MVIENIEVSLNAFVFGLKLTCLKLKEKTCKLEALVKFLCKR